MRTVFDVSSSWASVIAVEHDEETPREHVENAAWAFFRDNFNEKEFMRGADILEGAYADDEYVDVIRPGGEDGHRYAFIEEAT